MENENLLPSNFIHNFIDKDLEENKYSREIKTRFPPEPNGYLHIGHAKSICLNFGTAKKYNVSCNLRFDDTNPVKEDVEYIDSIQEDIRWLGFDWGDNKFFASDYFEKIYSCAVQLIKQGDAFVCDLSAEEIKSYRGTLTEPGKDSPYKNRSIEENLKLFEEMRAGKYADGEKVLRAKIDMASPNLNMRDPVIYRVSHTTHHRTGDAWCIYPMYDFAHPLSDAYENITHSICTLEFEDHRPLYEWFLEKLGFKEPPRQIEFARLELTDTVMSKRYLKQLVDDGEVDGWDDPRMPTICGFRRRGYTPEAIRDFCERIGVAKKKSTVDFGLLEYCIREDLKLKCKRVMAVIDPLKVVITNYPEDKEEMLTIENNQECEEMGTREVPFSRELYIEKADFMENPPKKYFRLFPGNEVRLKGAYFITCNEVIKDENGEITELRCTYDPLTKSGEGNATRKVKGTIHWVSAKHAVPITANILEPIFAQVENPETGEMERAINKNSKTVFKGYGEKALENCKKGETFQFLRQGYFCRDTKSDDIVFNETVNLKSSYKPE